MGVENLMVRNAVSSWKQWVGQIDKTIGGLGDEELQREVAPGPFGYRLRVNGTGCTTCWGI
jgi:hypothetical protein